MIFIRAGVHAGKRVGTRFRRRGVGRFLNVGFNQRRALADGIEKRFFTLKNAVEQAVDRRGVFGSRERQREKDECE
jgi:hypothetical protein